MISFIVTARPQRSNLLVCLSSIYHQTTKVPFDITVVPIYGGDWYTQSNKVVGLSKSEWLCFPNDDCYLVPNFVEIMLTTALETKSDIVYCDILYDPRITGKYEVLETSPEVNKIDKCCFIIKHTVFDAENGFPVLSESAVYYTDGFWLQKLSKKYKLTKAPGCLAVHN